MYLLRQVIRLPRSCIYKFFFILAGAMLIFILTLSPSRLDVISNRFKTKTTSTLNSTAPITILVWTTYFYGQRFREGPLELCPELSCVLTYDRSYVNDSLIVAFHPAGMAWNDTPSIRHENQTFVFFNWEPLPEWPMPDKFKQIYFNLTMTYRRDSTVFAPFGHVEKRGTPIRRDLKRLIKHKTRGGAWMVSHCRTHSKREQLVKKLQKYFPVDIYGKCGKLTCKKDNATINLNDKESCGNVFEDNYRFYFALENSMCTDYVTEKFWWRCARYIVPVVLERKNYKYLCPEYKKPWLIAADDFKSMEEMGMFLEYLMENDTAYYEYLRWHEHYEMVTRLNHDAQTSSDHHWCDLCRTVRNGYKAPAWDIYKWWNNDSGDCHKGKSYKKRKKHHI